MFAVPLLQGSMVGQMNQWPHLPALLSWMGPSERGKFLAGQVGASRTKQRLTPFPFSDLSGTPSKRK